MLQDMFSVIMSRNNLTFHLFRDDLFTVTTLFYRQKIVPVKKTDIYSQLFV